MKKTLIFVWVFLMVLVLDVGMSLAETDENDQNNEQNNEQNDEHIQGVPAPADSEAGLAGVVMAGGAAYLVSRRRKLSFLTN